MYELLKYESQFSCLVFRRHNNGKNVLKNKHKKIERGK